MFIPIRSARSFIRKTFLLDDVSINTNHENYLLTPVQPFAFVRVSNEIHTLQCSLDSILPVISSGIIAYNDCDDGSEEIIIEFCKNNPGFIPAKYDFMNLYDHENDGQKKARYYNWALSLMPKNKWLIKIDTDQIYDANKLKDALNLVKTNKDVILLPRINLHYQDNKLFVISNRPFNFSGDHWIIYNDDNLHFANWRDLCEVLNILDSSTRIMKYAPISNWHFPMVKNWRKERLLKNKIIPLKDWLKNWDGKIYDTIEHREFSDIFLDKKMFDYDHIMKYVKCFNF